MTILTSIINDAIDMTQEFAGHAKAATDKVIDEIQAQAPAVMDEAVRMTEEMVAKAEAGAPELIDEMKVATEKAMDTAKTVADKTGDAVKETLEHANVKKD